MDIKAILGDYDAVFSALLEQVRKAGIQVSGRTIDHICYRVVSAERYEAVHTALLPFSRRCAVTIHGDRQISTFRLKEPVFIGGAPVGLIELPAPKEGSPYPEGLEHIEVVVSKDFRVFVAQHRKLWTGTSLDDALNPTAHLTIGGLTLKVHPHPLDVVIALQGGNFARVKLAAHVEDAGSQRRPHLHLHHVIN